MLCHHTNVLESELRLVESEFQLLVFPQCETCETERQIPTCRHSISSINSQLLPFLICQNHSVFNFLVGVVGISGAL